jgi:hypothetical protein
MRLNTAVRAETETFGLAESGSFKFEMNAMAFRSVIDGIYADKIRAPVREYCTNAFDAHRMAGKADVPFDVQLPSHFDLTFRVRDYGIGLSHDEVMNLYSTMFASSKRDDNNSVGMIGLGSKSAFAYTSIFTITCWDGQEQRVYSAFIGTEGVPQMALMATNPSTEPTGVEISFPAKQHDIERFKTAAQFTFMGFDPKPRVVNENFSFKHGTIAYQGNGWRFYRDAPITTLHARQGCVIYPIDAASLGYSSWNYGDNRLRNIVDYPIIIDFEIGELNVATSRELLGYDDTTVANIKRRLAEVDAEITQSVKEKVDAAPSYLDACKLYAQAKNGIEARFWNHATKDGMLYQGRKLTTQFQYSPESWASRLCIVDNKKTPAGISFRVRSSGDFIPVEKFDDYLWVIDCDKGTARVRTLRQQTGKNIVWLKEGDDLKDMLGFFGSPDIFDLTTVEPFKVERAKRPPRSSTYVVKVFRNGDEHEELVDLAEGGVYVELFEKGYVRSWGESFNRVSFPTLQNMMQSAKLAGILHRDIIVLRTQQANFPNRFRKMVSFWDLIKAEVEKRFDPKKYAAGTAITQLFNLREVRALQVVREHTPKDIQRFLEKLEACADQRPSSEDTALKTLGDQLQIAQNKIDQKHKLVEQWEKLEKKYLLLSMICASYNTDVNLIHYMERF